MKRQLASLPVEFRRLSVAPFCNLVRTSPRNSRPTLAQRRDDGAPICDELLVAMVRCHTAFRTLVVRKPEPDAFRIWSWASPETSRSRQSRGAKSCKERSSLARRTCPPGRLSRWIGVRSFECAGCVCYRWKPRAQGSATGSSTRSAPTRRKTPKPVLDCGKPDSPRLNARIEPWHALHSWAPAVSRQTMAVLKRSPRN